MAKSSAPTTYWRDTLESRRAAALGFVRSLLKEHWEIEVDRLSDDVVEEPMWDNDSNRYLHLYELKVHY